MNKQKNGKSSQRGKVAKLRAAVPASRLIKRGEKKERKVINREAKVLRDNSRGKLMPKRASGSREQTSAGGVTPNWETAFRYPDVVGPQIYPISGAGARFIDGMSKAVVQMGSTSTRDVGFAYMQPTLSPSVMGQTGTLAGTNTVLSAANVTGGFSSAVQAGTAFPPSTSFADSCITTGCITIEYIGPPQYAQGAVLVATYDSLSDPLNIGFTYNSLLMSAGSFEIPVTELLECGLIRIPLSHIGPNSWTPTGVTSYYYGLSLPIVMCTSTYSPNGYQSPLRVTYELSYQGTPSDTGNGVPYDSGPRNYTKDEDAFQNAIARIGTLALDAVSLGWPEFNVIRNILPEWNEISSLFKTNPRAAMSAVHGLRMAKLQRKYPLIAADVKAKALASGALDAPNPYGADFPAVPDLTDPTSKTEEPSEAEIKDIEEKVGKYLTMMSPRVIKK